MTENVESELDKKKQEAVELISKIEKEIEINVIIAFIKHV